MISNLGSQIAKNTSDNRDKDDGKTIVSNICCSPNSAFKTCHWENIPKKRFNFFQFIPKFIMIFFSFPENNEISLVLYMEIDKIEYFNILKKIKIIWLPSSIFSCEVFMNQSRSLDAITS